LFASTSPYRRNLWLALWIGLLLTSVCVTTAAAAQSHATDSVAASDDKPTSQSGDSGLPLNFERHIGDLDVMVKRGSIRALVLYSRSGFFYVDGRPEGIFYEALQSFEQFVNQKLPAGQHVQVTFIPVRPDQLEADLLDGVGDLIAFGLVVTPERKQQVAFSLPIQTDVKQIVVTRKDFGQLTSLDQLGGKKVFVNPLEAYYQNLQKVNESLQKQGKPEILIEKADQSLADEDLLEMVNAGILPATVTLKERANPVGRRVSRDHSAAEAGGGHRGKPGVGDAEEQSTTQANGGRVR
jgi:ABC-type amino acid transport substrate-binding protein